MSSKYLVFAALLLVIFLILTPLLELRDMKTIIKFEKRIQEFGITEKEKEIFKLLLENLVNVTIENNIEMLLHGGAVLGLYSFFLPRHAAPIPWDDDVDILVLEEDMPKLKEAWVSQGGGLSYTGGEGSILSKLYSTVNYTNDFGAGSHNYPFLDVFIYARNSSYVHIYFDDLVIETDKLFPLNYVEFMGVSGLGVPRDMAGFLRVVLTESALTECATGERDHRREVDFEGPMLRMPCKKLLKWLDMKE